MQAIILSILIHIPTCSVVEDPVSQTSTMDCADNYCCVGSLTGTGACWEATSKCNFVEWTPACPSGSCFIGGSCAWNARNGDETFSSECCGPEDDFPNS